MNVLLFDDRPEMKPSSLIDAQEFSQYKADGSLHEQERDVAKYWKKKRIRISLVGLENQTKPDADMALRVISYEGAAYRNQLMLKQKKRYPVITLVLYFGTERRWTVAKSQMTRLLQRLLNDGRTDDLKRALDDKDYLDKLLEEKE